MACRPAYCCLPASLPACTQVWAGSKQRELDANSSQLLTAYAPHALWLLGIMVPIFEPIGACARMCVSVCLFMCMHMRVGARGCVGVCAYAHVCVHTLESIALCLMTCAASLAAAMQS